MRDLLREQPLPIRRVEQPQRPIDMPRLKAPRTRNQQLLASDRVRIELDVPRIGILPEHKETGSVAAVFQTFVYGVRMTHTLYNDVCPVSSGFGEHELLALLEVRDPHVNRHIGAELLRELQPVRRTAGDDDLQRAGLLCNGERRDADRSGTLDDDHIAPLQGTPLDSVDGGRQRASGADDSFGRERIRDTKDRRSGAKVDLFRVAATQMGSFIGVVGDAVRFASEAARRLRLHTTVEAFAACNGTRPADAISDLQTDRRANPSANLRRVAR